MAKNDNNQGDAPTDETSIRQLVETANAEDERLKQAAGDDTDDDENDSDDDSSSDDAGAKKTSTDDDSDDADDSDDDDSDDDDEDNPDDKKSQTDRKFAQYKGDGTDKSYISNLEKAHQSSTTEAINLRTELNQSSARLDAIMRAAATDSELATKLNAAVNGAGASGDGSDSGQGSATDNPFVADLQAQWREKSEKEIEDFVSANPEVASDPKIKADVQYWMGVFSNNHYERTGRLLSGGEAMKQAYNHLGLENKLSKQNLAAGAKKTATPTRSRGKTKQTNSQKPTFTDDQLAWAKSMGKDQAWLEKNAK